MPSAAPLRVSCHTSQPVAVNVIHVPIADTNCPIRNSRKLRLARAELKVCRTAPNGLTAPSPWASLSKISAALRSVSRSSGSSAFRRCVKKTSVRRRAACSSAVPSGVVWSHVTRPSIGSGRRSISPRSTSSRIVLVIVGFWTCSNVGQLAGRDGAVALDRAQGGVQGRGDLDVGDVAHPPGRPPHRDAQLCRELGGADVGLGALHAIMIVRNTN